MAEQKDYSKLTVAQIKEVFKSRGIPTTKLTKKQQLIDRLVEVDVHKAKETTADAAPEIEHDAQGAAPMAVEPEGREGNEVTAGSGIEAPASEPVAPSGEVKLPGELAGVPELAQQPDARQDGAAAEDSAANKSTETQVAQAEPPVPPTEPLATDAIDPTPAIPAHEPIVPTKEEVDVPEPAPTPATAPTSQLSQPAVPSQETVEDRKQVTSETVQEPKQRVTTPPSEDSRKRKRRSATPPVDEDEAARKRARQENEATVHMVKDSDMREAHAVEMVGEVAQGAAKDAEAAAREGIQTTQQQPPQQEHERPRSSHVIQKDQKEAISKRIASGGLRAASHDVPQGSPPQPSEEGRPVEPSIHPATTALYIRNLKRPLRPEALRDHLISISGASSSDPSGDSSALPTFHLDSIRTHAFAIFPSVNAAARARSALHQRQWPAERERELLWVDFVPEHKVAGWIEIETAKAPGGRPGMKRWEVVYDKDREDQTTVSLQEVGALGPSSVSDAFGRRPSGPLTPASAGPQSAQFPPLSGAQRDGGASTIEPPKEPVQPKSFLALDALFKSTTAKPKLYYQPVAKDLADRRLDELDKCSAPRMRGSLPMGGSGLPDSRRYTFEEGDLLVDGGPEFGLRGPAFGGRGGGGRGRGRGGWR